jgi:hypothetical protein
VSPARTGTGTTGGADYCGSVSIIGNVVVPMREA